MAEHTFLDALPVGSKILAMKPHGVVNWAKGYRVKVQAEREEKEYFLKVISRERHVELALAEFESQKALQQHLPDNVCVPLAHGTYKDGTASFFLTPFRHLTVDVPGPAEFAHVLVRLHTTSESPTGKYGFGITTFVGWVPINNDWCNTWEEWFTRQLKEEIKWEQSIRQDDTEFNKAFNETASEFFQKVIPRLLRPLETGGRSIKPVLLHGDLWEGNIKIEKDTEKVVLFDSCCCYGHNEMDLVMTGQEGRALSPEHLKRYRDLVPPSEPAEDYEDRHILYAIREKVLTSGLHDDKTDRRQIALEYMKQLLRKYPNGLDDFVVKGIAGAPTERSE